MMSDLLRFSDNSSGPTTPSGSSGGVSTVSSVGSGVGGPAVSGREDTQVHELINGEDLLKELEAILERLKALYNEHSQPLTDNTIEVSRFCRSLENILRHGQKEKLSFWGERKDYFHYLTESISGLKSLDLIVKKVQSFTEIVSGQGKGRALIRLCLNDQLLADCVQNSISNSKKTRDWYQSGAVLMIPSLTQRLISALYDLSDVTFSLPVDGLDLDEMWPSFVQKSFTNSHNSPKSIYNGGGGMSGLLKKALTTRDAKSINKSTKSEYELERAIEEEPSEIFVKHEVPFDLNLVSTLMEDIRTLLVDEFEGYSHLSDLPNIKVTQLDDISSGLSLLKDYVSTMSSDVNKSMDKRKRLVHQLKKQLANMETEVKEWKEKSNELEEELHMKDGDLTSSTHQLQLVAEEKRKHWTQVLEQREQISTLHARIAQLQEEKINLETDFKMESEMRQLMNELNKTTQDAAEINSINSLLLHQIATENESHSILSNTLSSIKEANIIEKQKMSLEIESLQGNTTSLQGTVLQTLEQLKVKEAQYNELELIHKEEMASLNEQLAASISLGEQLKAEKDMVQEEVKSMQGMVEQETASLRFQLSTSNMQLQQNNENCTQKDQQLIELKEQLTQLKDQLAQTRGALYKKEGANEELQQQLAIAESRSHSLQEELKSLNEQLTEKTLNRDALREEYLRQEREWDDRKERMTKETQRINSHATKVIEENEHLRKALQKLLAQKVSLWQHADELEQEQVAKGIWLDSREVTDCMSCQVPFTIFNRKHHCRSCGKVYCGNCCCHKAQLPSNKDPVRVCKDCYSRILSLRTPQASALVNTLSDDTIQTSSIVVEKQLDGATKDEKTSISSFPGGVALSNNNSLFLDGSDESLLAHIKELTNHDKTSHNSSLENSVEYSVEPLHKPETQSNLTYTVTASSGNGDTVDPDDGFCVIETAKNNSEVFPIGLDSPGDSRLDVNALRAKLARLESGGEENRIMEDSEKDGSSSSIVRSPPDSFLKEESDLDINGGMVHSVAVTVATPRTGVFWQFNSQPKGIAIGLNYQETEDKEPSIEVLPLRRVMSHKTVLTGEYVAQKAGVYTLVFSNAHSKYSGRVLSYKIWTKPPQ